MALSFLLASYISYVEWGRDWVRNQQDDTSQEVIAQAVATIESQMQPAPTQAIIPIQPPQESAAAVAAREATLIAAARAEGAADAQATRSAISLYQVTVVAMETSQAIAVGEARATAIFEAEATSVAQMNATVAAYREQYDSFLQAQVMATVQASYQSDLENVMTTSDFRSRLMLTFIVAFVLGNASLLLGMMYYSKPRRKAEAPVQRLGGYQLIPTSQEYVEIHCACNGKPVTCRTCGGDGEVLQFDSQSNEHIYYTCHHCRGTGKTQCDRCFGAGSLYRKRDDSYNLR